MLKLISVLEHGQSVWLDYIDRNLVSGGGLASLVTDGLRGVTSNPTIFHKAITQGADYDPAIADLIQAGGDIGTEAVYEWLAVQDVQRAADILAPVYQSSGGVDGYVSLEVSPHLARDTAGTVRSARHLWKAVGRPNLMVKVPATRQGLPAIEVLIAEGINVNVTLLFSVERYAEVFESFTRGLSANPEPGRVASVASFFVSRIDGKVDPLLERIGTPQALHLKARIAIASARVAYQRFRAMAVADAFAEQRRRGARVQRLLWGSTSTKDPAYRDVLYVESLIGPDTVNTVPPKTLEAFVDHGEVRSTLEDDTEGARRDLQALARLGIDLDAVTRELEEEGVAAFARSYDELLAALKERLVTVAKDYAVV
jgi:transaldolase